MKFWLVVFTASLSFSPAVNQGTAFSLGQGVQQAKPMTAEKVSEPRQEEGLKTNQRTADGKIHFSFQDQEWSTVIPWFSDQAGFSLQNVERWPDGTFNLQDKDSYSALEALDQLNRSLAGLSEPFTLIRKRKMLMLKPLAEAISSELIDSVNPADLDRRGAFEVMSVMFDLGELDSKRLYDELQTQVSPQNRDYFNVFSVSNQLQVRETGARLRNIRDIIETAKKKLADAKPGLITYKLKFQDAETFISVVGAQLGIPAGKVATEDGSISIIAERLGNRLYVSGSKKMLNRFTQLAKTVDSDPNFLPEELVIEQPYLQTYQVTIDPKLAYDLLSTMLEGSGARMQQDEMSGAITVLGRKADHERVVESLGSASGLKAKNFAIIALKKVDVVEALGVLQSIYRQNTLTESAGTKGPVLMANSYLNQIIVSGSAMEVAEVRSIAEELEARYVPVESGPRTNTRIIPMTQQDQLRLAPALKDLLGTVGRSNPFNVIRPEQRKDLDDRIHRGGLQKSDGQRSDDQLMQEMMKGKPSAKRSQLKVPTGALRSTVRESLNYCLQQVSGLAVLALGADRVQFVSNSMLFQQAGQATVLTDGNLGYRRPENRKSITGAPIEFRFTEYGLTVVSDDLDAADDIQAAIKDFLGESKEVQLPSFFELQHRNVQEMQRLLEAILGLSDSSDGGEGEANPLTGMMNNMLPGGDLFDGLLGGGGADAANLEGDVKFGADVRFNTLWVTGATGDDLSMINRLVEYWDRPEGETKPELFGKTRMIKVYHRDAAELVDLIKAQRPEMIYNDQAKQGAKDDKEVAEILKAVKSLTGGKGGGNTGDANAKQTVVLGADSANNMILVTGPKYMYDDILAIVESIDVAPGPRSTEVIPNVPNAQFLLDTLKNKYGKKLMVAGEEPAGTAATAKDDQQSNSNGNARNGQNQARQQLQRALQQQVRGQQGRGAGGVGRGGAGGGGRGGAGGGGGRRGGR